MGNEEPNGKELDKEIPGCWNLILSGVMCGFGLSIMYQAAGYLGILLGWHRRSSIREWVLATVIGFLIGCLVPLVGKSTSR